jgi:hypothetical protein
MQREELKGRISLQKDIISSLQKNIGKIKTQLDKDIREFQNICPHEYINECEPNSPTLKVCKLCDKVLN